MIGANSELAMLGLALTIMILIFAMIWFVFMVPMEKGLHKRRMELLQRKLQQNEERLRRERATQTDEKPELQLDQGDRESRAKKQASG
jgi:flagellar biosynthesis/type III secretory pathway M-ring protein FliF/YscJ